MHIVRPTRRYLKSIKRLLRSGNFLISDADQIINTLVSGDALEPKYRNHKLQGVYKDCFECHIKSDLLLIYKIDRKTSVLLIIDIGSHSELFE